jgi:hypothetical protein
MPLLKILDVRENGLRIMLARPDGIIGALVSQDTIDSAEVEDTLS